MFSILTLSSNVTFYTSQGRVPHSVVDFCCTVTPSVLLRKRQGNLLSTESNIRPCKGVRFVVENDGSAYLSVSSSQYKDTPPLPWYSNSVKSLSLRLHLFFLRGSTASRRHNQYYLFETFRDCRKTILDPSRSKNYHRELDL